MDDKQIVDLYFERSECAIRETQKKYGRYCYTVAYNILRDHLDSEECVNDTYLNAWNAMPPQRPLHLSSFWRGSPAILRSIAMKAVGRKSVAVTLPRRRWTSLRNVFRTVWGTLRVRSFCVRRSIAFCAVNRRKLASYFCKDIGISGRSRRSPRMPI